MQVFKVSFYNHAWVYYIIKRAIVCLILYPVRCISRPELSSLRRVFVSQRKCGVGGQKLHFSIRT